MSLRPLSLGLKATLIASAFALAVIALMAGTLLKREETRLLNEAERAAESYARASREAMTPRLDPFSLHYATNDALKTAGVDEAAVVDASGRILSDTIAKRIGGSDPVGRRLSSNGVAVRPFGDGYEIVAGIPAGGRVLGVARIRLSASSMHKALSDSRRAIVILAGLAALFNCFGVVVLLARERDRMRSGMNRFVSTEVADTVVNGEIQLEGRLCEVSIMFTDLRGFTRLSEHLPPIEVVRMLNDYFEQMVGIIERHGGWVDKFMGDGLLAVFGDKRNQPDHAVRAAACALELRECIARFNVERLQRQLASLKLGVAINSGSVVAGTVGSKARLDFTVIGDTVNVASRLEGLNTKLGTDLLVTEATYQRAKEGYVYEDMGEVAVKGHEASVRAYRLVGKANSRLDTPRPHRVKA